jgi:hypothetical protein
MPKNVNSASRVVNLLRSIPSHAENTQTMEVWATLLQVQEQSPQRRSFVVSERLAAMYRELDLVREQMHAKNFSEELYASAIAQLEAAFSTMNLHTSWPQARQHLTAETMTAMAFCGEIIDNEEDLISDEDLAEISSKVEELERSLEGTTLPPRLRRLIQHHIELIRTALAEYPIVGTRALRQAYRTAVGEVVEVREEVQAHPDSNELTMLSTVWKRVNSVIDVALKVEKVGHLGHTAWDIITTYLPG